MKRNTTQCFVVSSLVLLSFSSRAKAQDRREVILPAGTMLHCTLDEPDLSSKTADVGDPVLCRLSGLILFNRPVFPRGAYLAGHLEADKEPGHFVGKGYLKIEFDRIGLPDGVQPLAAKIIATRGFRVNRKGEIVGHGHARRDAAEWMLPPLWPEKILTLPARGPRPTLKGEVQLTLRLMDDVTVPGDSTSANLRAVERPARQNPSHSDGVLPRHYFATDRGERLTQPSPPEPPQATAGNGMAVSPKPRVAPLSILVLRDGTAYAATNLRVDGNRLTYVLTNGAAGGADLSEIDWNRTFQKNAESNVTLTLEGAGVN